MRSSILPLALVYALLCSSGCATIVRGRYQDLTINSTPPGAAFEVDGISGTTPATVPVERKQRYHYVVISKPGYETAQYRVGRRLNCWTLGNVIWAPIFVGPFIGVTVDLINGSAYRLADDSVDVHMRPEYPLADQQPANASAPGEPPLLQAQHIDASPAVTPKKPSQ